MEKYYAGIGSRKTPKDICRKMFIAGASLASLGYTLRSGAAAGADTSFEQGSISKDGLCEIFLPWKNFRGHASPLFGADKEARDLAKRYHPKWDFVLPRGRDFHGRNSYQILGRNLQTPARFVLCWTPGGAITGGTGQALRIAQDYDIPILNFGCHDDEYISDFILKLEGK